MTYLLFSRFKLNRHRLVSRKASYRSFKRPTFLLWKYQKDHKVQKSTDRYRFLKKELALEYKTKDRDSSDPFRSEATKRSRALDDFRDLKAINQIKNDAIRKSDPLFQKANRTNYRRLQTKDRSSLTIRDKQSQKDWYEKSSSLLKDRLRQTHRHSFDADSMKDRLRHLEKNDPILKKDPFLQAKSSNDREDRPDSLSDDFSYRPEKRDIKQEFHFHFQDPIFQATSFDQFDRYAFSSSFISSFKSILDHQ